MIKDKLKKGFNLKRLIIIILVFFNIQLKLALDVVLAGTGIFQNI